MPGSDTTAGARTVRTASGGADARRACLLALVALFLAFCALYPYLDGTGSCGDPGCPHLSHSLLQAHAELPAGALASALIPAAAPALAGLLRRRPGPDGKPAEVYLSPEPEPPRTPVP